MVTRSLSESRLFCDTSPSLVGRFGWHLYKVHKLTLVLVNVLSYSCSFDRSIILIFQNTSSVGIKGINYPSDYRLAFSRHKPLSVCVCERDSYMYKKSETPDSNGSFHTNLFLNPCERVPPSAPFNAKHLKKCLHSLDGQ